MKGRGVVIGGVIALLVSAVAGRAEAGRDPLPPAPDARNPDAAATLVVFNETDAESRALAGFYAEQRGIAREQVIGLPCPPSEEISRADYDRTIAEPLRRALTANFWWKLREPDSLLGAVESNKIRFVALMRGIPLKIAATTDYPGDDTKAQPPIGTRNEAAVDSELATLGFFSRKISGALNNPYFRSFTRITDLHRPELMLVCRLDGPSDATVRRMILDGLATEKEGLAGFAYVDARGLEAGAYHEGDEWLTAIAAMVRRQGLPVVLDTGPEMFPEDYPMRQAALYYGWYAGNAAGPFLRPGFHFARGAVAVHIHSFSAATVRDAQRNWVAPLLSVGAAATLGNVYEPYLTLTAHLDVFQDRLRAGLTFAEAAYMSQRVLSWMGTCVGDPLYRPFKGAEVGDEKPETGEWAAYREASKLWFSKDRATSQAALKTVGRKLHSGMIFEGLGLLELTVDDRAAALDAFQQARKFYKQPDDVIRVAIHEVIQLRQAKRETEAQELTRKMTAAFPEAPSLRVLRMLQPQPTAAQ
jgi:uncharacterized protein (TIGR03790 family)